MRKEEEITMTIYGYARVSTVGQTSALQKESLAKAGVERLYAEKVSAKEATKRPELERVLNALESGDVLVVTKLDRLARSTRDLLNIIDRIDTAGAKFRSLADAAFDTTTPTGKLMLTVLGGIADYANTAVMRSPTSDAERAVAQSIDAA